jgi:flagellar motor switch protein FliG
VFEPKEELDKIFDTDRARKAVSPKRLREAVRHFERVLERKEECAKESSKLTYETLPVALSLKKKAVSYSISQSERETYFAPEVISPKRGCFR